MNENERKKVIKCLPKLLELSTCNVAMIAYLKSEGVFSRADETHLNAISDSMERTKEFIEMLIARMDGYKHLVNCLKISNQSGALHILEESYEPVLPLADYFGPPGSPKFVLVEASVKRLLEEDSEVQRRRKRQAVSNEEKIIFFNIHPPSKLFTGRSKELQMLKQVCSEGGSTTAIISQNSSIVGLGGIGKTELAKMFIQSIDFSSDDPLFNCVIWINSETEEIAGKDLRRLATDKLKISTVNANGVEEDISSVLDKIYSQLESRKSLLVFDNMENADILEKYRRGRVQSKGEIFMVVTSQQGDWNIGQEIRLSSLEEADAIEFVKKGLGILGTELDSQISQLVSRLEYFPLAISQAIAFIRNKRKIRRDYQPKDYIVDLDSKTKTLLSQSLEGTGTLYKKTVYQTVELTLHKIEENGQVGKLALKLVKLMSFMGSDGIVHSIFAEPGDDLLEDALILLEKYSIVQFTPPAKGNHLSVSIHRLVQDVVRDMLETKLEYSTTLADVLTLLEPNLSPSTVDHAIVAWKHASQLADLIKQFKNLPSKITKRLIDVARPNDALNFATAELETLCGVIPYSEDANVLVKLEADIAHVLNMQFKTKECQEYVSRALSNAQKFLHATDPAMLKLLAVQGNVLFVAMQFEQALNIFQQVYADWMKNSDRDKASVNFVLHRMGSCHLRLKNYDQAVTMLEKVVANGTNSDSEAECTVIAEAKMLIGYITNEIGKPEVALEQLEDALQYANVNLNPDNLLISLITSALAVCLFVCGRIEEAHQANKNVHAKLLKTYGPDHLDTLISKHNILQCRIWSESGPKENLLSDAIQLFEEMKRLSGETFFATIAAYALVGYALAEMGMPEQSIFILRKVLMSSQFVANVPAYMVQDVKYYVAICLEKLGEIKEALEYLISLKDEMKLDVTDGNNRRKPKFMLAYDRLRKLRQESM